MPDSIPVETWFPSLKSLARRGWRFLGDLRTPAGRRAIKERGGYQGAVFHAWLFPITRHGKLLMLSFAVTALPASISVDVPIYEVSVGVVCLLLSATTVGSWYRFARTGLSGGFPATVVAGDALRGSFRVANRSWVGLYDLGIGCFLPPRAFKTVDSARVVPHVPPGDSAELAVVLQTKRRGRYALPPVRVFTLFPFGIGRNELARLRPGTVTVLPRPARVRSPLDAHTTSPSDEGDPSRRGQADPTDYLGSREYVPGDDIRRVDHRAWSRWGRPVVREFSVPSASGPVLVYDARLPAGLPANWTDLSVTGAAGNAITGFVPREKGWSRAWQGFWERTRRLAGRGARRLEAWFPVLSGAKRRYRDDVLEASVSIVVGLLEEWSGGANVVRFHCGTWAEPIEIGPGATSFEAVWDRLADPLTKPVAPEAIAAAILADETKLRADVCWITGERDAATREAVARLEEAGARVRLVWVTRAGGGLAAAERVQCVTPRSIREEVVHVA